MRIVGAAFRAITVQIEAPINHGSFTGGSQLEEHAKRLQSIPVAVMGDTLAAAGFPDRILSSRFVPLENFEIFAGPAVCFSGSETSEPDSLIYETDRVIYPGCIVIVASGRGCPAALLGGNMISSWRRRGCAGLLVDGFIRDRADFADFPALTTCGVTPVPARRMWRYESLDAPVSLPGQRGSVIVRPGDWLHGDQDGCLVLPVEHLETLLDAAASVLAVEARIKAQILAGIDREQAYLANDRYANVPNLAGVVQ